MKTLIIDIDNFQDIWIADTQKQIIAFQLEDPI